MKTVRDFDVKNKRVLIRCDFNVSLDEAGNILEDFRIKQTVPTISYLIERGAKIILISHLGDPAGVPSDMLRLDKIRDRLEEILSAFSVSGEIFVIKANDCVGSAAETFSHSLEAGEILLLENLRFHKGEEENDDSFSRELAKNGDIYLNDAFGVCHRAHASVVGVPKYLPKGMGLLLEKEIRVLTEITQNPQEPMVVIIGGKKLETKIKLINNISKKADAILVSGLIAKELADKNIKLKYPEKIVVPIDSLRDNLDIGPKTIENFCLKILQAKTVFWNGPLGKFEDEEFCGGTRSVAGAIIRSRAFSVIGGGETIGAVNKFGLLEKFNHVSTGGGAMLAFLAGEPLVGIEALK